MYVLEDGGVKAECVVTDEGGGILELKNLAVEPEAQRKGYGKALIDFLVRQYAGCYALLQVGTGDSPLTVPFYEKCGFVRWHRIPNFFTAAGFDIFHFFSAKLEVDELLIILRCVITMQFQVLCISRLPNHCFAVQQVDTNA